jgi:hypothetical protein
MELNCAAVMSRILIGTAYGENKVENCSIWNSLRHWLQIIGRRRPTWPFDFAPFDFAQGKGLPLRAHVGDVDVDAGVDVVKRVPAIVVGIFIDDEIVGTIPAPISADGPIPGSDFKVEAAGKPEAVMLGIKAFDAVAEGRANVFEAAVFEGMIDVKALIVGTCVAVPMVIVDVGSVVDVAGGVAFRFGLGVGIVALGRRRRDMALIGARGILAVLSAVLGDSGKSHKNCQSN